MSSPNFLRPGIFFLCSIAGLFLGQTPIADAQKIEGPQIVQGTIRIYGNDSYPVPYRRAQPIDSPRARYPGYKPQTLTLKAGTVRIEGAKILPCDILFERDVAVKLRDGITIYTDVFRPVGNGTSPAIVAWGPYGKQIGGQHLDDLPGRAGIPRTLVSELQKFEAADPAYWVCNGYTILNPDARGAYYSEGNITYYGRQLAEDGYDFVEWAAAQPWSNKKVAFSGNSYLAISQWFIAAEQPPHLAAIAPWEGFSDSYREASRRGGIAVPGFGEEIIQSFAGRAFIEDFNRMQLDNDLMNPYWEDKIARLEKIKIPAYVVASYTSTIHTYGTFEGFRRIQGEKWLRVHNTDEWDDYYNPNHVEDLRKFFDHYLKGTVNGWENTPRVRLSILDPGANDTIDRIESNWPVPDTKPKTLYLQPDNKLSDKAWSAETKLTYDVTNKTGGVEISFKVPSTFEFLGYGKVRLWVQAIGSNDMELTVAVLKRGPDGKDYPDSPSTETAAAGLLRVSHRALDAAKSTDYEPYHPHTREQLLSEGEIVPVDIGLWPMGIRFRAGETLVLSIAGTKIPSVAASVGMFAVATVPLPADGGTFAPGTKVPLQKLGGPIDTLPPFVRAQGVQSPKSRNNGTHVIHFGGKYDSYLLLPTR